ncbi:hypothetical protein [Burkholderia stagnalis]|uniref:hypothetical protein n=1 Tax=Burkholderia stagnalis TaxID=1503054 RepID=UPI00325B7999
MFGGDMAWVHVKDRTQAPAFAHPSAATRTTCAGFVQPSNDPGAQGTACLGDLALGGTASFYFEQSNRAGFRCTTLDPQAQNRAARRLPACVAAPRMPAPNTPFRFHVGDRMRVPFPQFPPPSDRVADRVADRNASCPGNFSPRNSSKF